MADLSKDTLLDMYRNMVVIRRLEEKSAELYQQGLIGGFLHLYIGQEATGVGAVWALGEDDHVITAYRDHGIAVSIGIEPKYILAEMMGKTTGVSKGKGGSMHLADKDKHFWGGYAIVGGHLPLATGLALRARYKDENFAVLCLMGDGSTNIGYFHESLNMSAVWDLPVVWMIENNQYGMGTAVDRASGETELVKRAVGYGMKEGPRVDGMDVLAVYDATKEALEYAKKNGPILMESLTYRFVGHSMGDPERYRTKEEVHEYQEGDPIRIFGDKLIGEHKVTQEQLDVFDREARDLINEAVEFATNSPNPEFDDLFVDIYS
ncbi:MAG: pyruvate dehydrogenase (acetyl-transferring) E1 component subunit alpha [Chloroflexi bacterium]|nr:pyruvate dehydrogenase (acetyl-transferring) E1 component subunit alpha [Chloroflexota bacterium]